MTRNFQHDEYDILARLCWSKNVRTEAGAPQQILLGASDPHYYLLLEVSTRLEYSTGAYGPDHEYFFMNRGSDNPVIIKVNSDTLLKRVLGRPKFGEIEVVKGKKGTQSA